VFWTAPTAALALAGLGLTGLGLALQFPLAITRAIALSGGLPDLANARSSLGVGSAVGVGPFVLGALADRVGPHPASLVVPVLLALAAIGVRAGARDRLAATPGPTG
jgi:fucose permease